VYTVLYDGEFVTVTDFLDDTDKLDSGVWVAVGFVEGVADVPGVVDKDFLAEREFVDVTDGRAVVDTLAVCEIVFSEVLEWLDEVVMLRDICAVLEPVILINDVLECDELTDTDGLWDIDVDSVSVSPPVWDGEGDDDTLFESEYDVSEEDDTDNEELIDAVCEIRVEIVWVTVRISERVPVEVTDAVEDDVWVWENVTNEVLLTETLIVDVLDGRDERVIVGVIIGVLEAGGDTEIELLAVFVLLEETDLEFVGDDVCDLDIADESVPDFDGITDFDGAGDRLIELDTVDVEDSVGVEDTDILPLTLLTLVIEPVCVIV